MKRRKGEFSDNIMSIIALLQVIMKNEKYKIYKNKCKKSISREAWFAVRIALADKIRLNHSDQMIDVDRIIELDKQELADRIFNCLDE